MSEKINVYQRLQKARIGMLQKSIKETGRNTYADYAYLELDDFLPHAINLCELEGLCGYMSYGVELASLTIVNMDNPADTIIITTPMSKAALKGCHEVQNLGAVMTYIRRYLWITALEITEHDALDATANKKGDAKPESCADPAIVENLKAAATLDDLVKVWGSIPPKSRPLYSATKDARKAELAKEAK